MKAIILAAGRGERMRPLSDAIPKPLLKVGDHCLIEYHLLQLKAAGVEEVVINISHLASQFMETLGTGERYGLRIIYSHEENGPLGTGGGIFRALQWLGDAPFIVVSGDIWTDFSFSTLKNIQNTAHLVMVQNPDFHPEGDFGLSVKGNVTLEFPKFTYGNIAVIHPRLFKGQKNGIFSLASVLHKAVLGGEVSGELYQGHWYNLGTPKQLADLQTMNSSKIKNLL